MSLLATAVIFAAAACSKNNGGAAATDSGRGQVSVRDTSAAVATRDSRPATRRLLFVGTSLTAGLGLEPDSAYPQRFARMVDSAGLPYEVVNAGVSGETSAGLLRRLDWLLKGPVDVFVLETGANDGLRGIPVPSMAANMREAIGRVRTTHPDAAIYLVQMEAPPNLGRAYTEAFHASYGVVAQETGATLLPFLLDGVAGKGELNQPDGIHPNSAGARLVAEGLFRELAPALRARAAGPIDPSLPTR